MIDYVWLGFLHMATGWDHLLFITGVVLLAGTLGRATKLISLFVVGHSATLLVAWIAAWRLNPAVVDVVIALSVAYVGGQGIRGRPSNWRAVGAVVFGFGLVHGLGLSTRLQDLGLPEDGIVGRVVLFNVGVELGQLAALSVIVGVGTFLGRRVPRLASASRVAFASLVAAGLVAAAVLSFPSENSRDDNESLADTGAASTSCKEAGYEPPPFLGGGHPAKSFYEPGEKASGNDLVHVMYDGYMIVTYADDLPSRKGQELEEWVLKGELAVIAASEMTRSSRYAPSRRAGSSPARPSTWQA